MPEKEKMTVSGIVTRLVAANDETGAGSRVFLRPDNPAVLRVLDGRRQTASGEVHVFADISQYKVGEPCLVDVVVDHPASDQS